MEFKWAKEVKEEERAVWKEGDENQIVLQTSRGKGREGESRREEERGMLSAYLA